MLPQLYSSLQNLTGFKQQPTSMQDFGITAFLERKQELRQVEGKILIKKNPVSVHIA